MDLPTYTNIWRIEKRLYKLYDLRLPMPLPVVWIGVFVGVSVPWWVFLYLIGLPFAAPWHVVYLVPPGVLTWLSTRPVIENKRLTELLQSQLRYMSEPRTWCRMAPFDEPDEIAFTARVWRRTPPVVAARRGRAAGKARRGVSVKLPVTKVSGAGVRPPSKAAAPAGASPVDPSRVVRPAVAAAAAAAAPVADAPPATPRGAAARTGSTGDRVVRLSEPTTRPASAGHDPVREEAPRGRLTGPERDPHEGHGHESHHGHEGRERASAQAAASSGASADTAAAPAAPPIGTETLRRLRRLAAAAEPHAARSSGVTSSGPGEPAAGKHARTESARDAHDERTAAREDGDPSREHATREGVAHRGVVPEAAVQQDAEILEQHRRGRPPRLGRPRVPASAWGEASRASFADPEQAPAVRAPGQTGEVTAPAAGAGVHPMREGTHAPGSRPYEDTGEETAPGMGSGPAEQATLHAPQPDVPTDTGEATPPPAGPAGVSIRAVPAGPRAAGPAGPARPPLPAAGGAAPGRQAHGEPPRLRRVEAVVGRDTSGGWRRLAQVVVGGSRTDGMEIDEARARTPLSTSRRIMVLGCTGGAGQTTTALMLGHTLARYRDDRVLALDANTGEDTLTTRIAAESPETLSSLIESSEEVTGYLGMRAYTTRCESGLEVVGADTDDRVTQRLAERAFLADWRRTLAALDRHYRLTVIDPAAALAARLLPYADQLVLVAPASEDASEAVAMTYEWLDGHGCSDLRRRAIMVINGVSRRSLPDVEQAEAVASGRCRAIVRVPWEDELAPGRPGPVDVIHLRMGARRAYVALAGVIVSGLAAVQAKQEVAR